MRERCWKPVSTVGLGVLLLVPALCHAWEPITLRDGLTFVAPTEVHAGSVASQAEETPAVDASAGIPPWGRALGEPSPSEPMETGTRFAPENIFAPPVWVNMEYLLWWTRNGTAPPLITRGQSSDPRPGALDQPYTKILYGGAANDINFEERHGGRFTFGVPVDPFGDVGIEASYFFLTARATGSALNSPGTPILAQPFYNALNQAQDAAIAAYPGQVQGSIAVRSTSLLQGAEANGTSVIWQRDRNTIALLAGMRYLNLTEDLQIASQSTGDPANPGPPPMPPAPAPLFPGAFFAIRDRFQTWDDFYGGQLGLTTEWHYRRVQFNLLAKVALGDTHETSRISGQTQTNFPTPINVPAGLLALSSNSGTFHRDALAVVPEAGVSLGLRVTEHLTLSVGYTFLYWSEVARPGSQVDLNLNPNLIPTSTTYGVPGGPARPAPTIHGTEFWAQGVTASLLWRY